MNYYKSILQYDGSERMGFQRQVGMLTIQGDLDLSLQKIFQGSFTTRAASRTDIGVHAIGQVVKISTESPTTLDAARLNAVLPAHIKCLEVSACAEDFIPSMDQSSKEYLYLFTQTDERYLAQAPGPLNIGDLQSCVDMLKGSHDFRNFYSLSGNASTTVRKILECDLTLIDPRVLFKDTLFTAGDVSQCWQFRINGTGFLKHMVRHLVGALWLVGAGKIKVNDFANYLHGEPKQQRPWKKADPRGLYLLKVSYEPGQS